MIMPATSVFHRHAVTRNIVIRNTLWYTEMKDAGLIQSFICCFSLLLLVKLLNTLLTVLSEVLLYVLSREEWTLPSEAWLVFSFSFLEVKNDFKSQYLGWWYFWCALFSFKLLLYSPLLCKNEGTEKNSVSALPWPPELPRIQWDES